MTHPVLMVSFILDVRADDSSIIFGSLCINGWMPPTFVGYSLQFTSSCNLRKKIRRVTSVMFALEVARNFLIFSKTRTHSLGKLTLTEVHQTKADKSFNKRSALIYLGGSRWKEWREWMSRTFVFIEMGDE